MRKQSSKVNSIKITLLSLAGQVVNTRSVWHNLLRASHPFPCLYFSSARRWQLSLYFPCSLCPCGISTWISNRHLNLDTPQTELIIISPPLSNTCFSLSVWIAPDSLFLCLPATWMLSLCPFYFIPTSNQTPSAFGPIFFVSSLHVSLTSLSNL